MTVRKKTGRIKRHRGLFWGLVGLLASGFALRGATGWAYRLTGNEPVTLALGLLGCVISLIGIIRTVHHQSNWPLIGLILVGWVAFFGALADGGLLWLGRTITGFY